MVDTKYVAVFEGVSRTCNAKILSTKNTGIAFQFDKNPKDSYEFASGMYNFDSVIYGTEIVNPHVFYMMDIVEDLKNCCFHFIDDVRYVLHGMKSEPNKIDVYPTKISINWRVNFDYIERHGLSVECFVPF